MRTTTYGAKYGSNLIKNPTGILYQFLLQKSVRHLLLSLETQVDLGNIPLHTDSKIFSQFFTFFFTNVIPSLLY